jgi:hypothetical protein
VLEDGRLMAGERRGVDDRLGDGLAAVEQQARQRVAVFRMVAGDTPRPNRRAMVWLPAGSAVSM